MKDTQKSAKSTTGIDKTSEGFTDEERAATKERARELRAAARRGPRAEKADGERAVLAKIAEMPEPDRALSEQLHAVIKASAPALLPRLWYGMPAYAKDGKVVCFFQSAQKFKTRYATFGFSDEVGQGATFHIDHVVPVTAGGATVEENLALACVSCSLRKGARQTAYAPDTDRIVPIFNPRVQAWAEHFMWQGVRLFGTTPTGRATVEALNLNRPAILAIRAEETALGRNPVS